MFENNNVVNIHIGIMYKTPETLEFLFDYDKLEDIAHVSQYIHYVDVFQYNYFPLDLFLDEATIYTDIFCE